MVVRHYGRTQLDGETYTLVHNNFALEEEIKGNVKEFLDWILVTEDAETIRETTK